MSFPPEIQHETDSITTISDDGTNSGVEDIVFDEKASDFGEAELMEVQTEASLFQFNSYLQNCLESALRLRKAQAEQRPNRPHTYLKNSARKKREDAAKRRELAKKGQIFINQYFPQKIEGSTPIPAENATEAGLEGGEGGGEAIDLEDDVDIEVERIFEPQNDNVSNSREHNTRNQPNIVPRVP